MLLVWVSFYDNVESGERQRTGGDEELDEGEWREAPWDIYYLWMILEYVYCGQLEVSIIHYYKRMAREILLELCPEIDQFP